MKVFFHAIVIVIFFVPSSVWAMLATDIDFTGYMRAGSGTSSRGGDQMCFRNPGSGSNEFRLGNECGFYGETAFIFNHLKKDKKFFKSQVRFAYSPDGHDSWEDPSDPDVAITEAFMEGGNFGSLPLTYWIGKRLYRGQDIWMNDWYYFANTSGVGAGVGNISLLNGKLHLAQIRRIGTTVSDAGTHGVTLWDARLKDILVTENNRFDVWLGYATSPEGRTTDEKQYDSSKGYVVGVLYNRSFAGGFNHLAILYGEGLLDEFGMYGSEAVERGDEHKQQKESHRWRFVEHLTLKIFPSFEFHFATALELRDSGAASNSNSKWYNIGIHPVYYINDHYQLVGQAGYSVVKEAASNKKTLTRLTFAPQVSISSKIWGRPVLRVFYTQSFWSKANQGQVGTPDYANKRSGAAWGFQGEVFF